MEKSISISGSGGQGLKFMGKVLAKMLHDSGKFVAFTVIYDAAVRGGEIQARIVYSDKKVENPIIERPDIFVKLAKNKSSCDASICIFESGTKGPKEKGEVFGFTQASIDHFGSSRYGNIIALGKLLSILKPDVKRLDYSKYMLKDTENNVNAIKLGLCMR